MSVTNLSTLPHITVYQDDMEDSQERPINVTWYNGSIELEQGGQTILIEPNHLNKLFNAIKRNNEAAMNKLDEPLRQ